MSVLKNNNRQDKVLFKKGGKGYKFEICITNLFTTATKENVKLDGAYINSYNSTKYNNISEIRDVSIYPATYITFNYNDYEERENNCSIFASFPNLEDLQDFITAMYNMVFGENYFSKKNNVVPSMKEAYIPSEPMGGGKQLVISPISIKDDVTRSRAGILSLYDPEKDLQYGNITLTENEIFKIYNTLINIDNVSLLLMSDNLCIMSMLALGAGASDEEESGGARPARRGLGGNRAPSSRKPSRGRGLRGTMTDNSDDEDEEDIDEEETEYVDDADDAVFDTGEDDEEEEEEVKPKKSSKKKSSDKKSSSKKSSSKKSKSSSKKLSMDAIMEEAEGMEYDEDDDDIDFDEDDEE